MKQYLENKDFDIIVTPHLYPAETLTWMKRKGILRQKTVAIATDYTSIPFWEETECDYYVIPHEDLINEFVSGVLPRKTGSLGGFGQRNVGRRLGGKKGQRNLSAASRRLDLSCNEWKYGIWKDPDFVLELARRLKENEEIVVICGNNKKLEETLKENLEGIEGYASLVSQSRWQSTWKRVTSFLTKPGGLSSTEAAVSRIPIIHTNPIPGCENRNLEFFEERHMSIGTKEFAWTTEGWTEDFGERKIAP